MAKVLSALSPLERNSNLVLAKRCPNEGVILTAGVKAAAVASIATAIPTMASVKMLPWARANLNLNHTAQALIITIVAGATYFIVTDKTVLATARTNSFKPNSNAEARSFQMEGFDSESWLYDMVYQSKGRRLLSISVWLCCSLQRKYM